jgi:MFS family permease
MAGRRTPFTESSWRKAVDPAGRDGRLWSSAFVRLCLVGFCYYACVYLLLSVMPLYLARGGLTDVVVGALLSLMNASSLIVRPFAGWLTDVHGRRRFIVIGLIGLLVGTAGLPFAGASLVLFALLRIMLGLGWGNLTATANTLAGELVPAGRRGEALGLYTMFGSLALAAGPAAGLYLARAHGYATAFWVAAAFAGLSLLLAVGLPEPRRQPRAPEPLRLRSLISIPALGPAALVIVHTLTYGALVNFLPLLAASRSLGDTGLFFTIYAVLLLFLRSMAGRLSDRVGRAQVIAPGLLCGAATMIVLATAHARWEMLAAAVLFALAMAGVQPPSQAWGLDLAVAGRRGTAMSTIVMAQDVGIAASGPLLGWVATGAGLPSAFWLAGMLGIAAVFGLGIAWRRGAVPGTARARAAARAG